MLNFVNLNGTNAARVIVLAGYFYLCVPLWAQSNLSETGVQDPCFAGVGVVVADAIAAGETPGAVVVFANRNDVLFAQAYGDRQVEPVREAMTLDTVFDLASITKPVATGMSVMKLVDAGKISVDDTVTKYLPAFGKHGKDKITIAQLLTHMGGLIPDNALSDYQDGQEKAWQRICDLKLRSQPDEKFAYTDVGFIVLGKLVQKVSGVPLDRFAKENLYAPLGMNDTTFNPPEAFRNRAAATERRGGKMIRGEVHDPRAYAMNGVAGHAGLFSTAGDLVRFGQMMLGSGKLGGTRILSDKTFATMIKPRDILRGTRAYGWDHQSPYSRNRGAAFSSSAIGHGGFTGTVFWVDPDQDLIFIFLATRLHPDGKGSVNALAGEIATMATKKIISAR